MESKCEVPGLVSRSEILLGLLLGRKGGKIHIVEKEFPSPWLEVLVQNRDLIFLSSFQSQDG